MQHVYLGNSKKHKTILEDDLLTGALELPVTFTAKLLCVFCLYMYVVEHL